MTDATPIPTEPARRRALRAALIDNHRPQPAVRDLDQGIGVRRVVAFEETNVSCEFTIAQAGAIIAVANAIHYAGVLSTLLSDAGQRKAFRSAIKELKLARVDAVRMVVKEE